METRTVNEEVSIELLEKELQHLKEVIKKDEYAYTAREKLLETRVALLENYIKRLESRLTLGKGVFIGLSFTIGGTLFAVWDKARDTVIHWLVSS